MKSIRTANSVKELELLLTIGAYHLKRYFEGRPVRLLLRKLGFSFHAKNSECMKLAQKELSDVDYDYNKWETKYGDSR